MKSFAEQYTLTKEVADEYVNGWESGEHTLITSKVSPTGNNLPLDAFVFKFEEFVQFVDQVNASTISDTVTGVVCRIGIKPNLTGIGASHFPCLIFEAVADFHTSADPIESGVRYGDLTSEGNTSSDRYDFSYPCPPTCPAHSS
ncbi:MAG: hypothetical protein K0S32_1575 [Bacteroidetes bacterium]|jgi:hypothetical protein|nr:hypothetical protein [Bacteroidota bacterium]